jgi:hypothetical protein
VANTSTVSLKLAPECYAVVRAMAMGQGLSVSEFLRLTLADALDMERQVERMNALFASAQSQGRQD